LNIALFPFHLTVRRKL